jgi:heme exporter protein C
MFLQVPDELNQGAAFRILYFHVPAAFTSFLGFFVAMCCSIVYLIKKNLHFDSIAASITEVSLAFATITLITGSIWGRIIWGIWWTWDARITSYFVCWLMFVGYLMLRRAIDDPTQRARLSAVLSIFGCVDIVIVWKSIEWWRTQHPGPVLEMRGGGGMAPGMEAPLWWNFLALLMLSTALIMVRMRQEGIRREIDALRRYAHAF